MIGDRDIRDKQDRTAEADDLPGSDLIDRAGLLLAAGRSRRMGGRSKLLLALDGRPVIRRAAESLAESGVGRLVVVLGHRAKDVRRALEGLPVEFVENRDFTQGMGHSIAIGVAALGAECRSVVIALGDMPRVNPCTVRKLIEAHRSGKAIAVPVLGGRRGHPVLFDLLRFRKDLASLSGDAGARGILDSHPEEVGEVPVDDPGIHFDIDTPEDYARARHPQHFLNLRDLRILVRGAGEMASGVILRLLRSGFRVAAAEQPEPSTVRRTVAFSEAVWDGACEVEGVRAVRVSAPLDFDQVIGRGEVPVNVDPEARCIDIWKPHVLVDAILAKRNLGTRRGMAEWVIGLGPGFSAGEDVDVVIETNRGHDLGRLYLKGRAAPDTGVPASLLGFAEERVLRAPAGGLFRSAARIADAVTAGEVVAEAGGSEIRAGVSGVLRGVLRDGVRVVRGQKVGDVDPRGDKRLCYTVSDKARALGGSALEAVLMRFNR